MSKGTEKLAEITVSFLVANLNREDQGNFLQTMDRAGFGLAAEGLYRTTVPPLLAEKMPRTATFTFYTTPNSDRSIEKAVVESIEEALRIAKEHNVHVLACRHHMGKEGAA